MPLLSDFILSRDPYRLKWFVRKFIFSCVPAVLQIFAVGHLLQRYFAISIWGSPFKCLLCSFPVEYICSFCPSSVCFFNFVCWFFEIWYLRLLLVARHAVQSLTFCSRSFRISGHQKIFASNSAFAVPE